MTNKSFTKRHSGFLRLWHWLNALIISGLLMTIVVRNNFFNTPENSTIILSKLKESKIPVPETIAKDIAKSIREPFWEWHYYLGFILTGLILVRFFLYLFRFDKSTNLFSIVFSIPFNTIKQKGLHYRSIRRIYAVFYFFISIMMVTGLMLYFKKILGLDKSMAATMKEIHEYTMWGILLFIGCHLAGVLREELFSKNKGIVSDMIHGGEKENGNSPGQ